MKYLADIFGAFGAIVDKIVPGLVGLRTQLAVLACPVLMNVKPIVPAKYQPTVELVEGVLCTAAPAFALAGLARKLKSV